MIVGCHTPELIWYPVLKYGFVFYVCFSCLAAVELKACFSMFFSVILSDGARIFDRGLVLAKIPDKRENVMEIFPDNENYIIKVLSCQILKESDRHSETDLIAKVKVNTCTMFVANEVFSCIAI